jgi:hypothetical protein
MLPGMKMKITRLMIVMDDVKLIFNFIRLESNPSQRQNALSPLFTRTLGLDLLSPPSL